MCRPVPDQDQFGYLALKFEIVLYMETSTLHCSLDNELQYANSHTVVYSTVLYEVLYSTVNEDSKPGLNHEYI
jgi:hypothetical protein